MAANDGHLIYALDDAYIHMAMAKNLADHGVFGMSSTEFTFTSSAPLWTGLLALVYKVLGPVEWAPLALGLLAGIWLLWCIDRLLVRLEARPWLRAASLFAVVVLVPLPMLVLTGLEHVLHAALSVFVLDRFLRQIERDAAWPSWSLLLGAALLAMARYEGLFQVFACCCLLALRRRVPAALLLGATAIAPVLAIGQIAVANGWWMLPNSVLLKGKTPAFDSIEGFVRAVGGNSLFEIGLHPHMVALLLPTLVLLASRRSLLPTRRRLQRTTLAVFAGTTILHLQFARIGAFYRYDGYLIVLALVALAAPTGGWIREQLRASSTRRLDRALVRWGAALALAAFVVFPVLRRSAEALSQCVQATTNIYEQQFQVARFLRQNYGVRGVAANDIGAIGFFSNVDLLDLYGLANMEVARNVRAGTFDAAKIEELAERHGCVLAAVYEHWYRGLPANWVKVGTWRIRDNVVCGGDTVSFFATRAGEVEPLREALAAFAPLLPRAVTWTDSQDSDRERGR